jgi:hypothetical protein
VDALRPRLRAVGQGHEQLGQLGVAVLLEEPRHVVSTSPGARLADDRNSGLEYVREGTSLICAQGSQGTMAERTKTEIRKLSARLSFRATPYDWLEKARALRRASNHLFIRFEEELLAYEEGFEQASSFELVRPDSSVLEMLLGFAIENLLKGLYVSTQKIANPRTLRELGVSRHDLSNIANEVAVKLGEQLSKRDLDILVAVEQTIMWRGRYPSPIDVEKLISSKDSSIFSAVWFRYPDACTLYDRLEALLIPRAPFSIRKGNLGRSGLMPGIADD